MQSVLTEEKDTMTLTDELAEHKAQRFVALILDNEVTVGEFVTRPPLPWTRLFSAMRYFKSQKDIQPTD